MIGRMEPASSGADWVFFHPSRGETARAPNRRDRAEDRHESFIDKLRLAAAGNGENHL